MNTNLPEIKVMSTKDLVKEYNERTGKTVKKFSTRAVGERMVAEARVKSGLIDKVSPSIPEIKPGTPIEAPLPKKLSNRSDAIARTWTVKAVADKRAKRDGVTVDSHFYKSVLAAFKFLGLPQEKHIKFRMELKATGEAVWKDEKNPNGLKFKIVKQQDLPV